MRISLFRGWILLLVVQCRVVSNEKHKQQKWIQHVIFSYLGMHTYTQLSPSSSSKKKRLEISSRHRKGRGRIPGRSWRAEQEGGKWCDSISIKNCCKLENKIGSILDFVSYSKYIFFNFNIQFFNNIQYWKYFHINIFLYVCCAIVCVCMCSCA